MKILTSDELHAISRAVKSISKTNSSRVDIYDSIKVYKVPSNSPNKYTIRIDIRVKEDA